MFYAGYNSYGTGVTLSAYNEHGWEIYAFETMSERDEWVNHERYVKGDEKKCVLPANNIVRKWYRIQQKRKNNNL